MTEVTRRGFLQGGAAVASGLLLGCQTRPPQARPHDLSTQEVGTFDTWLNVTPEGRVVLVVDKVEMGQGTWTGSATAVGEELEVDPLEIEVRHAWVDDKFDSFGIQGTGGSTSLSDRYLPLRETAARARIMLERAGAERMQVPVESVSARDGFVSHPPSARRLSYGSLAADAASQDRPKEVTLKTPEEFRFVGQDRPRVDGRIKSRGEAMYGMDTQLPGMLTAVVVRPPHAADRIRSFQADRARKMRGVVDVFEIPTGVAVLADSYWRARQAAKQVNLEVERRDRGSAESAALRAEHRRLLQAESGKTLRNDGDTQAALQGGERVIEVEYFTPHQAHATMEPMNCTIDATGQSVQVFMGTQAPGIVRDVVADVLGRKRDDVVVHSCLLGGGFGRRFMPDVAYEAAEIARRSKGPVKLVYSREDDMARDFYRPATAHRFRGAVDAQGTALAWEHRLVAPSLLGHMAPRIGGALGPEWMRGFMNATASGFARMVPRFTGPILAHEGAENIPYKVENVRVESVLHDPGIQVGIWRSVGHSNNGFVVESFVDELAVLGKQDPVEFRRNLLAEHPRHIACLDLVAEQSDWGNPGPGRSQGVAVHESFDTVVAQVAEVNVVGSQIRVERVVCAVDCGMAVNPEIVRSQIESGVVFGLTAALKSQVTFEDGVVRESNFDRFQMLRMNESPAIEVHIVPSRHSPSGVGEPGTPPIAAAVANAVYAATGQRLRELPLRLQA